MSLIINKSQLQYINYFRKYRYIAMGKSSLDLPCLVILYYNNISITFIKIISTTNVKGNLSLKLKQYLYDNYINLYNPG